MFEVLKKKSKRKPGTWGARDSGLEMLENRRLLAYGFWPRAMNMDDVFASYPWLDGGGNSVAVIDKGIDYFHPVLGGNQASNTVAPRIVNVYDYRDNDLTPFPSESEATDISSAHGTGVAGLLAANYHTDSFGNEFKGILQDPASKLYNLRVNRLDSQNTTKLALQWVIANRVQYDITAVNLTDFVGTGSTPVYASEVAQLKAAGVFIASPVANDWILEPNPRGPIGFPAASPDIFGIGGVNTSLGLRAQTQRGTELDLIGPAEGVTLPYYKPSTNEHQLLRVGSGNSWATPHVVGAAVLLQQIDPTLTPDEIMQILKQSGVATIDPDTVSNPNGDVFYSRLDMLAAVELTYATRDDIYDQGSGGSDDLAHAGDLTLSNGAGSIGGLKLLTNDADYYKFTVTAAGDYDVDINYAGASAFPTGALLNSAGSRVAVMGADGTTRRLTPGTYYIELTADQTLAGTYSVSVNPNTPPAALGANGTFNGVAHDSAGNVHFAWFDESAGKLKYSKRTGNTWSSVQIVDAAANTGTFMSMALDSTGTPGVAYYDEANTALKYAKFNGSAWSIQTIDSALTTGYYPSLKFGAGDRPAIAYYYRSSGDLKFAAYTGTRWSVTTVDSRGDVGRYPSLALNPATGRWGIAYEKTTTGDFRVAEQNRKSVFIIQVVDATKFGGGFVSMAYTPAGLGAFSYYDAFNADLKYARYTGSKWTTAAVAAKNSQGLYTNLFLDPQTGGLPVIYFFNKTSNTTMAARSNGSGWIFETVATNGGRQLSVGLDPDGFETFAYRDDGIAKLRVSQRV